MDINRMARAAVVAAGVGLSAFVFGAGPIGAVPLDPPPSPPVPGEPHVDDSMPGMPGMSGPHSGRSMHGGPSARGNPGREPPKLGTRTHSLSAWWPITSSA